VSNLLQNYVVVHCGLLTSCLVRSENSLLKGWKDRLLELDTDLHSKLDEKNKLVVKLGGLQQNSSRQRAAVREEFKARQELIQQESNKAEEELAHHSLLAQQTAVQVWLSAYYTAKVLIFISTGFCI